MMYVCNNGKTPAEAQIVNAVASLNMAHSAKCTKYGSIDQLVSV